MILIRFVKNIFVFVLSAFFRITALPVLIISWLYFYLYFDGTIPNIHNFSLNLIWNTIISQPPAYVLYKMFDAFDNFLNYVFGFIPSSFRENMFVLLVLGLLTLILLFAYYFIFVILIPVISCCYVASLSRKALIIRKNASYNFLYDVETLFHLKHKERINGTEWLRRKNEKEAANAAKIKAENERKKREEEDKQREYERQKEYEYQQEQNAYADYAAFKEWQRNGGARYQEQQRQQTNDSSKLSEIEAARILLFLDETFTLAELKQHRNILLKNVHSDNGGANDVYAQKVNRSYEILKPLAIVE